MKLKRERSYLEQRRTRFLKLNFTIIFRRLIYEINNELVLKSVFIIIIEKYPFNIGNFKT